MRSEWQFLEPVNSYVGSFFTAIQAQRPLKQRGSGTRVAFHPTVYSSLDKDKLERRTKQFAIDCTPLCAELEQIRGQRRTAFQLSDASGSVAANHRAMRRARSNKEFRAKLQIVCEEIDESIMWLEIADATCARLKPTIAPLLSEARELCAIFSKARSTARSKLE